MKPTLFIFAGPNGAGKSSIVHVLMNDDTPIVNPDVIAEEIRKANKTPIVAEPIVHIIAGRKAIEERRKLFNSKKSFAIETTFSGNAERLIDEAKSHGYYVYLIYVSIISNKMSALRVKTRASENGHNVHSTDIMRRHQKSLDNLASCYNKCDEVRVLENSYGNCETVFHIRESKVLETKVKEHPYLKFLV